MKKETFELIEKIKKDLKENMSEKRFEHSVSVMKKAIELAKIYNEDEDEAALAGLTHDIAKEIPDDEAFMIAEENGIELDEIEKINTKLLHGKIGAFLAKEKYGFNERITDAIKFHTETVPEMDNLSKIVYVADKIEDTRVSDKVDLDKQREVAMQNLDDAVIMILEASTLKQIEKGRLIHPNGIYTRNYLLMNKINE